VKLEGSLDAFSLPDIFQLLSFTKKSGGLHLRRSDARGCVYFSDGAVTAATSDEGRQSLARRLIAASVVADADLAAAVTRAEAESGVGVARALLDAEAVEAETLRTLANENTIDAVFDFLRWSDGDFSFSPDEQGPDDVGIALPVEDVVAAARSRLEAWDVASGVVAPSAVLGVPLSIDDDAIVTQEEWALLALVDGRRNVGELVELAGQGEFVVVSALAALVERNLLAVLSGTDGVSTVFQRFDVLGRLETAGGSIDSFERAAEPDLAPETEPEPEPEPVEPIELADEADETDEAGDSDDATGVSDDAAQLSEHDASVHELLVDEPTATEPPVMPEPPAKESPASPFARTKAPAFVPAHDDAPIAAERSAGRSVEVSEDRLLVPDTRAQVVPGRPEGFGPRRRPDFPDDTSYLAPRPSMSAVGGAQAAPAPALDADPSLHIERDPSVNKSLLLRLIAGVRGL
jgi:hypothetical protein